MAFKFCLFGCLLLGTAFSSVGADEVVLDDISLRGMLTGRFVFFFPSIVFKNFLTGPVVETGDPAWGRMGVLSFSGLKTGSFEVENEGCVEGNTVPLSKDAVSIEDVEA